MSESLNFKPTKYNMQNVQVKTSQNVQINYQLASIVDRILAYLIDVLIIIAYMLLLIFVSNFLSRSVFEIIGEQFDEGFSGGGLLYALLLFLIIAPIIFYHLLCEQLMQGQSFGKRAMQVKVVKIDGSQPKFGNYFIRWILRIIDSFPYWGIGICTILLSQKSQRMGDLGANTIVIKLKPEVTVEDTIFAQVDSNHVVRYANVLRLTDRDVEIIKSIMNQSYENPTILMELNDKIRSVIEAPEDELLPAQFLNQVLKDYNYKCVYG